MQKNLTPIKKIIFTVLMLYMICGLTFFLIFTCSSFSFVSSFIRAIGWSHTFFNDGIIGPIILFIPEAFVIAAIVWIFFRKETSPLLRGVITAIPIWQLVAFYGGAYLNDFTTAKTVKYLIILLIAGFVAIFYLLFRELRSLFRKSTTFSP